MLTSNETVMIGIVGKMRTGKDLIARLMNKTKRGGFERGAYADELKKDVDRKYGKQEGGKCRELLQYEGQEQRKDNPDVWIERLQPKIDFLRSVGKNVVITDVRQQNEIDSLREQGAYIIRVKTDDAIRKQRIIDAGDEFKEADFYHITETQTDDFEVDYEIQNDGGLIPLIQQLDAVLINIDRKWRNQRIMKGIARVNAPRTMSLEKARVILDGRM